MAKQKFGTCKKNGLAKFGGVTLYRSGNCGTLKKLSSRDPSDGDPSDNKQSRNRVRRGAGNAA